MSLQKNIVFVHIPKAGGTSVRKFISAQVDESDIYPQPQLHHFPRFQDIDVAKPSLFLSHLGYDFVRAAEADAFVLMRHPIERLLSLYSYARHPGDNVPIITPELVGGMSLTDFFTSTIPAVRMNIDNAQTWQIASGYAARHRQLRLNNGATIERILIQAKRNLDKSAVVGTLENMAGFYAGIANYFGREDAGIPEKAANVSEKRVVWNDLSDAEKALVDSCVAHEWEVYDHAKKRAER